MQERGRRPTLTGLDRAILNILAEAGCFLTSKELHRRVVALPVGHTRPFATVTDRGLRKAVRKLTTPLIWGLVVEGKNVVPYSIKTPARRGRPPLLVALSRKGWFYLKEWGAAWERTPAFYYDIMERQKTLRRELRESIKNLCVKEVKEWMAKWNKRRGEYGRIERGRRGRKRSFC